MLIKLKFETIERASLSLKIINLMFKVEEYHAVLGKRSFPSQALWLKGSRKLRQLFYNTDQSTVMDFEVTEYPPHLDNKGERAVTIITLSYVSNYLFILPVSLFPSNSAM